MQIKWEAEARDSSARAGKLRVGGTEVETPALLVVVDPDPKKQLVPLDEIKKMGIKIIMTSSFIAKRKLGRVNLKEHLGWDHILYTDSGTYQAYSRGVKVDPLESVKYQEEVGVDIVTPVDLFSLPDDSKDVALEKALKSLERWKEAKELVNKPVTAPVQGSVYPDVRAMVTSLYVKEGAELLAVGGIVPLMVNYEFAKLVDVLVPVLSARPPERAVHAFGAGHPLIFPLLVFLGVDLFDSAMYVLAARDKRYLTPFGTFRLEELYSMRDFPCDCPACSSITPRELQDLSEEEKVRFLARHNLYAAVKMVKEMREKILYGTFHKWALAFFHTHPRLYEAALRALRVWRGYFERERNYLPKSPPPKGCYLCDLSPEKDPGVEGRAKASDFINSYLKRGYGVKVKEARARGTLFETELGSVELRRPLLRPSESFLSSTGKVVKVKELKSVIKKKDILSVPKFLRPNQIVLASDGQKKAIAKSLVSWAEYALAGEEAVILLLEQ